MSSICWVVDPSKVIKRFKYCFGPQPLAFVLNWSSIFQSRVKIVLAVKCWMENADMANVITPFLPPGFSRMSAHKTRQPEPSRPDPTRDCHIK